MSVFLNELVIASVLTAFEDDEVLNIAEAAAKIRARIPSAPISEQDIALALISEAINRHVPIEFNRQVPTTGSLATPIHMSHPHPV